MKIIIIFGNDEVKKNIFLKSLYDTLNSNSSEIKECIDIKLPNSVEKIVIHDHCILLCHFIDQISLNIRCISSFYSFFIEKNLFIKEKDINQNIWKINLENNLKIN